MHVTIEDWKNVFCLAEGLYEEDFAKEQLRYECIEKIIINLITKVIVLVKMKPVHPEVSTRYLYDNS